MFEIDACTLPSAQRPLRLIEFETLFTSSLVRVERPDPRHLRLTLRGDEREVVAARCDSLTNCSCPDCPLPFIEITTFGASV